MKLRCRCGSIVLLSPETPAWKGWQGFCRRCRMVYQCMQIGDFERVT